MTTPETTTPETTRIETTPARRRAAAFVGALIAAAAMAGPASAQGLACGDVPVVADAFIQGYAMARNAGGAVQIALNEERGGAGLGRQTKEWLFERQCVLARAADASTPVGPGGALDVSLIEQQEADCAAFRAIVDRYGGQRNALAVIDRDVSAEARGSYWDASMGQIRNIASTACVGG